MTGSVVLTVQNLPVPRDRRVWREACALRDAGHQVTVIAPAGRGEARREVLDGIELLRYRQLEGSRLATQVLETLWALTHTAVLARRVARRRGVDVLHSANPPDAYFLVAALLRPSGTRFVYDQHDPSAELLEARVRNPAVRAVVRPLLRALERASCRSADLVVVTNETGRARARAHLARDDVDVVVVRPGPERVHPAVAPRDGVPLRVAFAGVIGRQDGVETLLRATAAVLARRPGSIVVEVIGDGDDVDRLQGLTAALGIEASVEWAGWRTGDDLLARLRRAAVGVSPDDDTSLNRVVTMAKVGEYLGAGLGCVAADLPENRATAGDAALYFRPGSISGLAACLERLVDDRRLARALAARAQDRATALLWSRSAATLVDAYDRLLAPAAGAPAPLPALGGARG